MIVIDLKLALFILLILVTGCGTAIWLIICQILYRTPPPNFALGKVQNELPVGLVVFNTKNAVTYTNMEGRRLLTDVKAHQALLNNEEARIPDALLRQKELSNGFLSHPVAVRWWRYHVNDQMSLLVLLDRSDYQRLVTRQQTFVGQLVHELRTPLTALIAHLEIARNPETGDTVRIASLDTLHQEIHRLTRLIRDLLELHRLESSSDLALCPTNLLLVVEDAIGHIFPQIEQKDMLLSLNVGSELPLVLAHADRLKQVFLNLLDNAVKYCYFGDKITIELKATPDGVYCMVADSGPGISNAEISHIKDPLYRGRTDVEGNGVGLALVSEILRQHHATLEIESATEVGKSGTTCFWTLQASKEEKPE